MPGFGTLFAGSTCTLSGRTCQWNSLQLCESGVSNGQKISSLGIRDASVSRSHGYTQKWNVLLLFAEASLSSWWPQTNSEEMPQCGPEKANYCSGFSTGFFKEACCFCQEITALWVASYRDGTFLDNSFKQSQVHIISLTFQPCSMTGNVNCSFVCTISKLQHVPLQLNSFQKALFLLLSMCRSSCAPNNWCFISLLAGLIAFRMDCAPLIATTSASSCQINFLFVDGPLTTAESLSPPGRNASSTSTPVLLCWNKQTENKYICHQVESRQFSSLSQNDQQTVNTLLASAGLLNSPI